MDIELKENERIDDLQFNNLKIIQNTKSFCFGIDSVLLSDFAKDISKNSTVLDLGTGTGILGILLCKKTELSKMYGIEIQQDMCEMASRSIKLNHLEDKFSIICDNIQNLSHHFKNNSIDAIVSNPPYKKLGTGITNTSDTKLIARHEVKASLEDFISVSAKALTSFGSLYMVHRPERLVDLFYLLRKYHLEPKKLRMVHSHQNDKPTLVLIKATKDAKSFLTIEKPLVIYHKDGSYTDEILKIYHKEDS